MGSSVSANAVRSSHVLATQIVMTISDSDWEAFKQYMASMPPDARRQVEQRYADEADALYNSFKASFMKGLCDTCGKPLTSFTPGAPCFHWLLRPKGCKKSHIAEVFQSKGYFRTASYIRWVCNQAVHIARINDLSEEGDKEAIFHWSGEYTHIKWTFLCRLNDYQGHQGQNDNFPHYHLEMRLNGRVFIKFNEYHFRLTDEDLISLRCNLDSSCPVKGTFGPHGSGMEDAFSIPIDSMMQGMQITDNQSEAVYHIQTVLMDEKGIPGEIIEAALKKSKETGKPAAIFLKEIGYNPKIHIEPPKDVPEKQIRHHPRPKTSEFSQACTR